MALVDVSGDDVLQPAETLVPVKGLGISEIKKGIPAVSVLPVLCLAVLTHLLLKYYNLNQSIIALLPYHQSWKGSHSQA